MQKRGLEKKKFIFPFLLYVSFLYLFPERDIRTYDSRNITEMKNGPRKRLN